MPTRVTVAPSAATCRATLAAPPNRNSLAAARTIGTGASGEMRSTAPHTYSSSIKSPTTRIDTSAHRLNVSSSALESTSACDKIMGYRTREPCSQSPARAHVDRVHVPPEYAPPCPTARKARYLRVERAHLRDG